MTPTTDPDPEPDPEPEPRLLAYPVVDAGFDLEGAVILALGDRELRLTPGAATRLADDLRHAARGARRFTGRHHDHDPLR